MASNPISLLPWLLRSPDDVACYLALSSTGTLNCNSDLTIVGLIHRRPFGPLVQAPSMVGCNRMAPIVPRYAAALVLGRTPSTSSYLTLVNQILPFLWMLWTD